MGRQSTRLKWRNDVFLSTQFTYKNIFNVHEHTANCREGSVHNLPTHNITHQKYIRQAYILPICNQPHRGRSAHSSMLTESNYSIMVHALLLPANRHQVEAITQLTQIAKRTVTWNEKQQNSAQLKQVTININPTTILYIYIYT